MSYTAYPFLQQLQQSPLLCDGAMGTLLHTQGIPYTHCFEQLNLTYPDLIKSIHLSYVSAGAQIIETNTFGANRYRLAQYGLQHEVFTINLAAAKIAHDVRRLSSLPFFIAGNIGPLASPTSLSPTEAHIAFYEQANALLQSNIDLFLLETFSNLAEMCIALTTIRSITNLPIVTLMTFGSNGLAASGEDPLTVLKTLRDVGANVIGANCSFGPAHTLEIVRAMSHSSNAHIPLAAQPNAGLPHLFGDQLLYPATSEAFAQYTCSFLDAGVRLLGGCCGTTPEHIAALKKSLHREDGENVTFV